MSGDILSAEQVEALRLEANLPNPVRAAAAGLMLADSHEVLRAERDAAREAHKRAEERIRELAVLFGVPDGGRYINDWRERAVHGGRKETHE